MCQEVRTKIVNIIDCNFFYERTLFHDYLFEFSRKNQSNQIY